MKDDTVLEALDLHYHYDNAICALQGLALRIRRGRKLAVAGANGAGKSTLFLHLNGILKPERGEIQLEGRPVDYSRQGLLRWRQAVGLVLQNPDDQLFAPTVEQDVSFGPMNLGLDEAEVRLRVEEALCALGIEELRGRPPHQLSFGQKKRAAIAGAVAMRPRVLILDEPSAGLDPQGVESLMAALDRLHAAGATLVMATHDINLVCEWADDVAILAAGRVATQGPCEPVLTDREILNEAGLRAPLLFEIGARLRAMGILPREGALPRSRDALLAALPAESLRASFVM
ncbi:MAG: ATP-binding cassette domain-containing protein [Blastocatellia bacterium]|nr:ATP-binding cassette domain-containing protein [Blastocatellia bacterium]